MSRDYGGQEEMTTYEFGVMSSKWKLEAKDIDSAKMAMILLIQKNIPIAIYKPKREGFSPKDFLINYKGTPAEDKEARKAYVSIAILEGKK